MSQIGSLGEMLACVKWKDKKAITLLSTTLSCFKCTSVVESRVEEYRRGMRYVDKADMLESYYAIDRTSQKWWHQLFWHFQDTKRLHIKDFGFMILTGLIRVNAMKRDMTESATPNR